MTRSEPAEAWPIGQGALAPPARDGQLAVENLVIDAVAEMLRGQDRIFSGPITPQTLLVADLDYKSLDVVMLIGSLNRQMQLIDIPFEQLLFANGRPVSDLSVQAVADFMWNQSRASADRGEAGSSSAVQSR